MGHVPAKIHLVLYVILAKKMLLVIYVEIVMKEKIIHAILNVNLLVALIAKKNIVKYFPVIPVIIISLIYILKHVNL
jgi:hypothetical protein